MIALHTKSRSPHLRRDLGRGMTLIELLVIMIIFAMLTAVTIPVLKPALEQRKTREAARLVSNMLGAAQARAQANGRPVGVWFQRFVLPTSTTSLSAVDKPEVCMAMYMAETPPPYSGDTLNAGMKISVVPMADSPNVKKASYVESFTAGGFSPGKVRIGDIVLLGYHANKFTITNGQTDSNGYLKDPTAVPPNKNLWWWLSKPNMDNSAAAVSGTNLPFQILRQPVKSGEPVQLPDGAVVDLAWSGAGTGCFRDSYPSSTTAPPTPASLGLNPVMLVFNSSGGLDNYYSAGSATPATQTFHLLIGKREKLNSSPYANTDTAEVKLQKHNWLDPDNFWVSVHHQTGLVTVAEVAAMVPVATATSPYVATTNIAGSRYFTTASQSTGGH